MSQYHYRPLLPAQIRLIRLLPGRWPDQLECMISHVPLDSSYEAVSYTWGLSQDLFPISIRDDPSTAHAQSHSAMLHVAEGTFDTLRRLRSLAESRTLWIDAVCINQQDVEERNRQVALMGQIYSHATQVLIYIGESGDDSSVLLETMRDGVEGLVPLPSFEMSDNPMRRALEKLLNRRWFSRVWVIQEVLLAREATLVCGDEQISWEGFREVASSWGMESQMITGYPAVMSAPMTSTYDLLQILQIARNCGAAEPQDKAFALKGLLADPNAIRIDYDASPNDIFEEIATHCLKRAVNVLPYVQGGDSRLSCVPDWTNKSNRNILSLHLGELYDSAKSSAGGPERAPELVMNTSNRLHCLRVEILRLGVVEEIAGIYKSTLPLFTSRNGTLYTWDNMVSRERRPRRSERNIMKDLITATGFPNDEDSGEVAFEALGITSRDTGLRCAHNRRLFRTTTGRVGLGPPEMETGDTIAIIVGSCTPYILRLPKEVDSNRAGDADYTVVGECLLQGVMRGEALDGTLAKYERTEIKTEMANLY